MARLRKEKVTGTSKLDNPKYPTIVRPDTTRSIYVVLGILFRSSMLLLLVGYFIIVFLLYTSYSFRHQTVFLNYLVNPFVNYSHPESRGISNTRNFYIQGQDGKIGVWHIRPKGSSVIDDGKPVVLYLHGNAYSRAAKHRIGTYKILSSLGCHVVAPDYRGFGDSDGYPTEKGLIDDSLTVFNWIMTNANLSPIFIWGHSLGSAVAVGAAKILSEKGVSVKGLVLETPFNNVKDAAMSHPISLPFRILPNFPDILQEVNDMFKSDERILSVRYSILILHGSDDMIIKFALGRKLYEAALKGQEDNPSIEFKEFHGYHHTNLYESEELPEILRKFINLKREHSR